MDTQTPFQRGVAAGRMAAETISWPGVLDMAEQHAGVRDMFSIGWRVGMAVTFEREFND